MGEKITRREALSAILLAAFTARSWAAEDTEGQKRLREEAERVLQNAKGGDINAQLRVARVLEKGLHGVKPNRSLAYAWYSLAAERGNPEAKRALKTLRSSLSQGEIDRAPRLVGNMSALALETTTAVPAPCYITTAVCRGLGLSDDCVELTVLRWYRDNVLSATHGGRQDIGRYYETAPRIVEAIEARGDAENVYRALLEHFVRPSVQAILAGRYEIAYALYKEGVERARLSDFRSLHKRQ